MRPFRLFFGLLFAAAAAFVIFKVLVFALFGLLAMGALFVAARTFRRYGPGRFAHHWQQQSGGLADSWQAPFYAEPLDPRQARPQAEPLMGSRSIAVL